MKPRIGFVLVTHCNQEQILYLCQRLSAAFDAPPIAVHHDFGQAPLDKSLFPGNVSFVEDWIATCWGDFSLVEAPIKALKLLYHDNDPDWFIAISGADYPIKTKEAILRDLDQSGHDAFLDHREIHYSTTPPPPHYGKYCFTHPGWIRVAYDRYMAIRLGYYRVAKRFNWKHHHVIHLRLHVLTRLLTPFRRNIKCYAGDSWLTGNRWVAHTLLADSPLVRAMTAHFRKLKVPEEGYYHSILLNSPGIKVSANNRRYTDWTNCLSHPRLLTESDFPELLASGDHFARKFQFDPELLQKLDQHVNMQAEYFI